MGNIVEELSKVKTDEHKTLADLEAERQALLKSAFDTGLLKGIVEIVLDAPMKVRQNHRDYLFTLVGQLALMIPHHKHYVGQSDTEVHYVRVYWVSSSGKETLLQDVAAKKYYDIPFNDHFKTLLASAQFTKQAVSFSGGDWFVSRGEWRDEVMDAAAKVNAKIVRVSQNAQQREAVKLAGKLGAYEAIGA